MSAQPRIDPQVRALLASPRASAIVETALSDDVGEAALHALGVSIAVAERQELLAAALRWAEGRPPVEREPLVALLRGAWSVRPPEEIERVVALCAIPEAPELRFALHACLAQVAPRIRSAPLRRRLVECSRALSQGGFGDPELDRLAVAQS